MSQFDIVKCFAERAQEARDQAELNELLAETAQELGFQYFALVHHVDLRQPSSRTIRLENYPESWSEYFVENGLYADDPVHRACLTTNMGFTWDELPKKIVVTDRQRAILKHAVKCGLGEGYTVPVAIPGESSGSCSFATRRGARLPKDNLMVAQLIGGFAFQAARGLSLSGSDPLPRSPRLTRRQRDCVLQMTYGKTDKQIGRSLGLSPETVNQHIEMARKRYGVSGRAPLLVRAMYDGQISFLEALEGQFPKAGE